MLYANSEQGIQKLMEKTFGQYLKEKRLEKKMSLRTLADKIELSAPYLSDIEHDRRNPLSNEKIDEVSKVLGLTAEERNEMFDIAASAKGEPIGGDIFLDAEVNKVIAAALRKARELNYGKEEWVKILEAIERKQK